MIIQPRLGLAVTPREHAIFISIPSSHELPPMWAKVLIVPTNISLEYVNALLLIQNFQVDEIIQGNSCSSRTLSQFLKSKDKHARTITVYVLEGTVVLGARTKNITLAHKGIQ